MCVCEIVRAHDMMVVVWCGCVYEVFTRNITTHYSLVYVCIYITVMRTQCH